MDLREKLFKQVGVFALGATLFAVGAYAFVQDETLSRVHLAGTILASIGIGLMIRMSLALYRTRRELKHGPQPPNIDREIRKLTWIVGYLVVATTFVALVTLSISETEEFPVGVICSVAMLAMTALFVTMLMKKRRQRGPKPN